MNEKNNNNRDTPRLQSINNNMLWFILSKAFEMSINTNTEIFFSIAFHRSSLTDRRAVSVEWCLQLPIWNCASLLLSSNRVVTKISSCRVNTTSRRGIKRLGISFGSISLLFSNKSSRGPLS